MNKSISKLLLPYMLLAHSGVTLYDDSAPRMSRMIDEEPPTKGQKALFNQPKKLSKKQKAKNRKK